MTRNVRNFYEANKILGRKKKVSIAHNTRLERITDDCIQMKYHGNPVVSFYPDRIQYSSCGWKTFTTKKRLNWCLPDGFYIAQNKHIWYLFYRGVKRWVFRDNVIIYDDDTVENAFDVSEFDMSKMKNLKKQIKEYVDKYIQALLNGEVPKPSGGDCWYCFLSTDDGQSLGESTGNIDHLIDHISEQYYVPSLLYCAVEQFDMCKTKILIERIWEGDLDLSELDEHILRSGVRLALTKYLNNLIFHNYTV